MITISVTPKFVYISENGGYSDWVYGECSVTCGHGEKIRYRRCNDPQPNHGGADCQGPYFESLSCEVVKCPGENAF